MSLSWHQEEEVCSVMLLASSRSGGQRRCKQTRDIWRSCNHLLWLKLATLHWVAERFASFYRCEKRGWYFWCFCWCCEPGAACLLVCKEDLVYSTQLRQPRNLVQPFFCLRRSLSLCTPTFLPQNLHFSRQNVNIISILYPQYLFSACKQRWCKSVSFLRTFISCDYCRFCMSAWLHRETSLFRVEGISQILRSRNF